jgi:hypothetical protein
MPRLPLPTVEGWIVLCLDMNSILVKYCCSSKSQKAPPLSMVALKVNHKSKCLLYCTLLKIFYFFSTESSTMFNNGLS